MSSKLEVYRRADHLYAWRLRAGNGEIIATDGGQGYVNRSSCSTIAAAVVQGLYAPDIVDLPEPDLLPGAVVLHCPDCDATVVGSSGDTLAHAEGGAHVHSMTYGVGA